MDALKQRVLLHNTNEICNECPFGTSGRGSSFVGNVAHPLSFGCLRNWIPSFLKTLAPFRVFLPRCFGWMPQYETHSDSCQGRSPLVLLNYNGNAENSQIQESNPKPTMHATQVCIACFPCRLEPILKSTLSHNLAVRDKIRKDLR